jgi:hypothetical protein
VTPPHEMELTRRRLLVGLAATAGLAGMGAACTSSKAKVIDVPNPGTTTAGGAMNVGLVTSLVLAGINQRVAFVLQDKNAGFIAPVGPVSFTLGPDAQHQTPLPIEVHADALGAPAYLSLQHQFPAAGVYVATIAANGKVAQTFIQATDPASEPSPVAGRTIPNLATPTTSNLLGVDPAFLCTRSPVCPWHNLSLDTALAARRPLALLFATPKYCQTRTCGPTLDVMLQQSQPFASKVQFMHLEIYPQTPDLSPGATAKTTFVVDRFKITSEPILYLVGSDGVVRERIDGLIGDAEVQAALTRLAG